MSAATAGMGGAPTASSTGNGGSGASSGSGASGGSGGSTDPNAPVIVQLSANSTQLDESGTLIISALVTDPDGIDDVIGGTLIDPDTGASYGALVSEEGAYSITLTWEAIGQVRPIEGPPGGESRTFRAQFSDVAAHLATGDVMVQLVCDEDINIGLCGGECSEPATDPMNCGACGHVCKNQDPVFRGGGCADGECCVDSDCGPYLSDCTTQDMGFSTCDEICGSTGEQCVEYGCNTVTWNVWNDDTTTCEDFGATIGTGFYPCNAGLSWEEGIKVRCCCTDTQP